MYIKSNKYVVIPWIQKFVSSLHRMTKRTNLWGTLILPCRRLCFEVNNSGTVYRQQNLLYLKKNHVITSRFCYFKRMINTKKRFCDAHTDLFWTVCLLDLIPYNCGYPEWNERIVLFCLRFYYVMGEISYCFSLKKVKLRFFFSSSNIIMSFHCQIFRWLTEYQ